MAEILTGKGPEDIRLFGAVDRKDKRADERVTSSYPAWYFTQKLDQMREEIREHERREQMGLIPQDRLPVFRAEIKRMKDRVQEIESSKPKLNAAQSQWLKKQIGDLETAIQPSYFTYDDMNTGAASPTDEMKRMKFPCIRIDPTLARIANVPVSEEGLVSRDGAVRAWQIARKLVGERSNSEILRHKSLTCRMEKVIPAV